MGIATETGVTGTGIANVTAAGATEANASKEETATARGKGTGEILTVIVSAKDMDVEERKSHHVAPGTRTTAGANFMMTAGGGDLPTRIVVQDVAGVANETRDRPLAALHLSVALPLHRTQYPYRSARGRLVDGMCMLQGMSSILPCRLSRLVRPDIVSFL